MGQGDGGTPRGLPQRACLARRDKKGNFTADKLLIADVVKGELLAVPARSWLRCGDAGLAWWRQPPERDIERVRSHLARYYAEMDGHGALG